MRQTSSVDKQSWLILSHCFNMDGRAASQTITDKIPHLMNRGITPIVLSGVSGKHDDRFQHRQLLPWGPAGLRFDLRYVIRMKFGKGFLYRLLTAVISIILAPFLALEWLVFGLQNSASWVFPATIHSLILIRKFRPTVIYTTGGAYSAHHAGYWLKRLTGRPWIAEIHDPMMSEARPSCRNSRFMAKLEGRICRHADLVWWFTDGALDSARRRHPELGNRGIVVWPGADPPKFTAQYQRGAIMNVCHFGSLSATRSLAPVVRALDLLLKRHPTARSHIRIHLYGGSVDAETFRETQQRTLQDVVTCHDRIENSSVTGRSGREQIVDLMHQSDCLLLVHGSIDDCREYIPSKLYEYFWARRPIIALTHENAQLDLMVRERNGYVAPYVDEGAVEQILQTAYDDWRNDRMRLSEVQPLGTEQAVEEILRASSRWQLKTSPGS